MRTQRSGFGIRLQCLVQRCVPHSPRVSAPITSKPNAMIQPARATPRSERRKKGLAINRNNQESIRTTPTATEATLDFGSQATWNNRSATQPPRNTTTTKTSRTRKTDRQHLSDFGVAVLMLPNDEWSDGVERNAVRSHDYCSPFPHPTISRRARFRRIVGQAGHRQKWKHKRVLVIVKHNHE